MTSKSDTMILSQRYQIKSWQYGDFPGGPMVKILCLRAGGIVSIPGQWTRSHMLCSAAKNQRVGSTDVYALVRSNF